MALASLERGRPLATTAEEWKTSREKVWP